MHKLYVTKRTHSFTLIPPNVRILSRIKGIQNWRYDLRDDVVSKMIAEMNERQILDGFNQNQIRDILQRFYMR